jgi:heat shock protein HtpX
MASKRIAKKTHKMTIINENDTDSRHRVIYQMVATVAAEHDIKTPEVGIYESTQPNAFATGASKNSALVAVSTGLLDLMSDDEVRAVVGHEMAHVLNGDMVSMTLLQ